MIHRSVSVLVAPPAQLLSLAEAMQQIKCTEDERQWLLDAIAAVTAHLDGWHGILGRALVQQTLVLRLDRFPSSACDPILLPCPPLRSVSSVQYVDEAGATQTMDSADYLVDTASTPGRLTPAYAGRWPTTRRQMNAVTITYVAGYAPVESGSPTDWTGNVPAPVKAAARLLLAHLYENREATTPLPNLRELPLGVQSLLTPLAVENF
jgi:uncharacterized phiE125 gp8 family phage protein